MASSKRVEPYILWAVQTSIPVPARLARRASLTALGKYMAKALLDSFGKMPPGFVADSAKRVQKDARKMGLRLVGPDGREFSSAEPEGPVKAFRL